jgi:molybdopterin synthase sulfur carrier subunit
VANLGLNPSSINLSNRLDDDTMAKVNVKFYGAVIEAAKHQRTAEVNASNVRELLKNLADRYGDSFKEKVLDSKGEPQAFVNIFVNNTDIRHLKDLETPLNEGDEILILPAVAGG